MSSNCFCEVHMFPGLCKYKSLTIVLKGREGMEDLTTCMATGRQRVDTQLGGRESRSEDLEALSFNVHCKLEHSQSRRNTAYR